jgi:GNAT superfamily N-acetyltransferase
VGRVAGIINNNANRDWNKKNVRFGWIDFIDDIEVTKVLLKSVEDWGKEMGMEYIVGPFGFTDMDKEGMLVDGFEKEGGSTTIYNYDYYPKHLEALGYSKMEDWFQIKFDIGNKVPDKFLRIVDIVKQRSNVSIVEITSKKELASYGREMFHVLNKSFSKLLEFTPLSEEQIDEYVKMYIPFLDKNLVTFIKDNDSGKLVGFAVTMPSLTKGYKRAKGSLFPFGFVHMLKALHTYDTVEMLLIGVLPEYQSKGLTALIFAHLHQKYIEYGFKDAISNPQLETNLAAQKIFNLYDCERYTCRRSYKKDLK